MRSLRDRAIRIIYTEPGIVGIIFIINILMSMKYPFVELDNQHLHVGLFLLFHYIKFSIIDGGVPRTKKLPHKDTQGFTTSSASSMAFTWPFFLAL